MKIYFSPYLFTTFLSGYGEAVAREHFARWIDFLSANAVVVPMAYQDLIDLQFQEAPAQLYPRLFLSVPVEVDHVVRNFECRYVGGVMPSCQGGFVDGGAIRLSEVIIDRTLDAGVANVVESPVAGGSGEIRVAGLAWALYLYWKLERIDGWNKRKWASITGGDAAFARLIDCLRREIGEDRMAFVWRSESEDLKEWLSSCDLRLSGAMVSALEDVLSRTELSLVKWRDLGGC